MPTGRTQLLRRRPPANGRLAGRVHLPRRPDARAGDDRRGDPHPERVRDGAPVRRRDGSVVWTHSRAVPLLDAQGSIREWIGNAVDITERRHKEQALNESQARYSGLLRQSTAMKVALLLLVSCAIVWLGSLNFLSAQCMGS
ncbi:PAS domain S-box protein [Massilia sp. PWRC2]|uniref:PAS domain S-box protein n=1 Tax=Massilia sp. PWRC2 TaxID=2804626 RepID=UPI003CF90DE7